MAEHRSQHTCRSLLSVSRLDRERNKTKRRNPFYHVTRAVANIQMEPTHVTVRAIMSPPCAAHLAR